MRKISMVAALIFGVVWAAGCTGDPNIEGAKLDLRNKDYARAIENVEAALASNPDNAEAHMLKGQILQEQAFTIQDAQEHTEMIREMKDAYDRAVEIDPSVQEEVDQRLRLAYYNEFQRGGQAFNRGRQDSAGFDDAVVYFGNAAYIQPDSASAYVNQAYSLLNAGNTQEAIEPFEAAVATGVPVDAEVYVFLSDLYATNERPDDAITILQQAREIYPEDPDVQAQLLNAYIRVGREDEALEQYQAAVEREPNNKTFRYNYGTLLLTAERYDEAIEQLKAAVAIDPNYAVAQYNLGSAYVNKAVVLNDRLTERDDQLRAERASGGLSAAQIQEREAELERMAQERRSIFQTALEPLERAKSLMDAAGDSDVQPVCAALFQAYVQTGQTEKAEGVSACAGF